MINSIISICMMYFEILFAEIIFSHFLHRRRRYAVRLIVCIAICIEVIILVSVLYGYITNEIFIYGSNSSDWRDSLFKFAYYLFVFALTVGCIHMCYCDSVWKILFYCSGGYAMQHLAFNISGIIKNSVGGVEIVPSYLIDLSVCIVVYAVCRMLLVKFRIDAYNDRSVKGKTLASLVVLFVCIGLSRITTDDSTRGALAFYAESLYAIISCTLILGILFSITQKDRMQNEVDMMEELLHREKEQFSLSKENIDIINMKCHDLKHQISSLRGNVQDAYVKEIENAVMIYSSAVKTGNDILDVLLTEKSLQCEKNQISLTCVISGEDLAFMNKMDIYSLFGNALSNAIESVRSIENKDRRCISVASKKVGGFLSVHIENLFDGNIVFENGLPMTRRDKNYHGFGIKSMKYIAEKYGGYMSVSVERDKFCLDFIFPNQPVRD